MSRISVRSNHRRRDLPGTSRLVEIRVDPSRKRERGGKKWADAFVADEGGSLMDVNWNLFGVWVDGEGMGPLADVLYLQLKV
jgi:hypothetical protein